MIGRSGEVFGNETGSNDDHEMMEVTLSAFDPTVASY
jgi:hypothetical protein